jgi:hypothetical protein
MAFKTPKDLAISLGRKRWNAANPDKEQQRLAAMRAYWEDPYNIAMSRHSHCKLGHEFTDRNTYIANRGYQVCRKCKALHEVKYREDRRLSEAVA